MKTIKLHQWEESALKRIKREREMKKWIHRAVLSSYVLLGIVAGWLMREIVQRPPFEFWPL